ncbi:MAG: copper-binding protein, partial [Nitrosopumilus sp. B06]
MRAVLVLLIIPLLIVPAYAESQTSPTSKGVLDVKLTYDPIELDKEAAIRVDFINPVTQNGQIHIDFTVHISKDGQNVFGPIPPNHTSESFVKISPIYFEQGEGRYTMDINVTGILFNPIPTERVSFDIDVPTQMEDPATPDTSGGGCLIATAAYGTELAPQVQQLRELRDNVVMGTESGSAFMAGFNDFYYSFSPGIADLERENPVFREMVKVSLTPLISSLSILNHAEIDSEAEMIGYGISLIVLNLGMYVGAPVFGIV